MTKEQYEAMREAFFEDLDKVRKDRVDGILTRDQEMEEELKIYKQISKLDHDFFGDIPF